MASAGARPYSGGLGEPAAGSRGRTPGRKSGANPPGADEVFTARRNARIASAVLATAIPSVCRPAVRPSVTRRYCVKTTARSTVQFTLPDSKMCIVL